MEKKNNNIVIALFIVIIAILTVLCILFATGTIVLKTNNNNNNQNTNTTNTETSTVIETPETTELTKEELINKLDGEWGRCEEESGCYGAIFFKNDNGEFAYTSYIMWSDGIMSGIIQETKMVEKNVYFMKVYFAGYEDDMGGYPEQTKELYIDISDISSNKIKIGDFEYQKINGDREEFFYSIR